MLKGRPHSWWPCKQSGQEGVGCCYWRRWPDQEIRSGWPQRSSRLTSDTILTGFSPSRVREFHVPVKRRAGLLGESKQFCRARGGNGYRTPTFPLRGPAVQGRVPKVGREGNRRGRTSRSSPQGRTRQFLAAGDHPKEQSPPMGGSHGPAQLFLHDPAISIYPIPRRQHTKFTRDHREHTHTHTHTSNFTLWKYEQKVYSPSPVPLTTARRARAWPPGPGPWPSLRPASS